MNDFFANGVGVTILVMMLSFIGIWIWAWLPYNQRNFDLLARMPMQDSPSTAEAAVSDEDRP